MAQLTRKLRARFPLRYARKDARSRIYRVLYGIQHRQSFNDPVRDAQEGIRHLSTFWSYPAAERVFKDNIEAAEFPKKQRVDLENRLASLKLYAKS